MISTPRPETLHFSITQMKAWLLCSRKFEYRYVRAVDPEFVPLRLAFGTAFHSALAHHYRALAQARTAAAEEVKQRFVDEMNLAKQGRVPLEDDEEGTSFAEAVSKGGQMLDVALAHPSAQAHVVSVEESFIVDLYDVESGEVLDEKLLGIIDLVVMEDGHRVLVEHKTSSRKYSPDQLNYDTQLSGYAFAAERLGWGEVGLRFSVVTKTKVPALHVDDVRRDEGDVTDFLRTAVGVLKAIDAGISFPVRGWQCRGCPYRSRCSSER
jgi:CRISPR/Cas system-associated exonuclease Cas4 (RecB family)